MQVKRCKGSSFFSHWLRLAGPNHYSAIIYGEAIECNHHSNHPSQWYTCTCAPPNTWHDLHVYACMYICRYMYMNIKLTWVFLSESLNVSVSVLYFFLVRVDMNRPTLPGLDTWTFTSLQQTRSNCSLGYYGLLVASSPGPLSLSQLLMGERERAWGDEARLLALYAMLASTRMVLPI
jgi:hypothetical protein